MTPFEYLARNYIRNNNANHMEIDEWWEDDVIAYRAYLAGAERLFRELQSLEIPGIEVAESLLRERFFYHEVFFISEPVVQGLLLPGGLSVKFGDGKLEMLSEVPCPKDYRHRITQICRDSSEPAACEMAFRMVQEFHGRSPEMVLQLGPLLFEHLMEEHNVYEGLWISFQDVLDFCDRMISQGRVTLENIPFPFIQADEEEDNLEWMESEPEEEEEEEPPSKPPEDDLLF